MRVRVLGFPFFSIAVTLLAAGTAGAVPITCLSGCVAVGANTCVCDTVGGALVEGGTEVLLKAWGGGGSGGPGCAGTDVARAPGGGAGYTWMRIATPQPQLITAAVQPAQTTAEGGRFSRVYLSGGSQPTFVLAAGGGSGGCAQGITGGLAGIAGAGGPGGGQNGVAGTNALAATGGQGATQTASGAHGTPSTCGPPAAIRGGGGLGYFHGGNGGSLCTATAHAAAGGGGGSSFLAPSFQGVTILGSGTAAGSGILPGGVGDADRGQAGEGGQAGQPGKAGRIVIRVVAGGSGEIPTLDFSIGKTDGLTEIEAGKDLTYTLQVSNNNRQTAGSAQVTDVFPSELVNCTWTCSAPSGSSCNGGAGPALSDLVTLGPAATVTYSVQCKVDEGASGTLSNTAVVAAVGATDPNSANDSATDTTDVVVP